MVSKSVSGLTDEIYNKLRAQAGRGGQTFSAMWADEMKRVSDGGLTGTSLAKIATRLDAEVEELKAVTNRLEKENAELRARVHQLEHHEPVKQIDTTPTVYAIKDGPLKATFEATGEIDNAGPAAVDERFRGG